MSDLLPVPGSSKSTTSIDAEPPVVFYRYTGSPFADKMDNTIALKGIPHFKVDVPMILPRHDLSDLLGVSYRRIPIVAIGNDVYCDTSLISVVLERRFPQDKGYGTLFPPRKGGGSVDTGMIKAFSMAYADRSLFPLGAACLPYKRFPPEFIADRSLWQGSPMDVEALVAKQPSLKSLISSHAALLEEQLDDGRDWLFDTEQPGYADISVHSVYAWILNFRGMKDVLSSTKFPKANAWISRLSALLNSKKASNAVEKIKGDAAAKLIGDFAGTPGGADIDFDEDEAGRNGLKVGMQVSVAPDDNAKNFPTIGKLLGFSREEIVVETKGSAVTSVRCHFPRLNFSIRPLPGSTSKL